MPAEPALEVHLLGKFVVRFGDHAIPGKVWRQRRAAAIVKLLALDPEHRLHREQILESLWPDLNLENAANNLRVALHHARRGLEDAGARPETFLVRDGDRLLLGPRERIQVDVALFSAAVSRAWQSVDPEDAQSAAALYMGDLLPEDPYEEWAVARREGLRASYQTLLTRLAGLHETQGNLDGAVAARELALARDSLDEEAHAALMRLHARMGNRELALAQFRRLSGLLERELGTAPERTTRELALAIRDGRLDPSDVPVARPSAKPSPPATPLPGPIATPVPGDIAIARSARLPAAVDAVVGRERELAELERLLTSTRLVTLTGPGGTGKTRLAEEAARVYTPHFPDGVAFIDLAPLRDSTLVLPTVASALGVEDAGGKSIEEELAAAIGERRMLLVLDNVEQVTAAGPGIAALLAACAHLTVLATSRVRLRLRGEHEYPVLPLALPERRSNGRAASVSVLEDVPAVKLFILRATAARPSFSLTSENMVPVVAVCRRLDGLPLAIELAAARVRVLAPDQLLRRLEHPLDVLGTATQDVSARQRTLRDTIAWSYDLLAPAEQTLFAHLGIFAGGWTLDAAEAITQPLENLDVFDGLASLVDKSLVRRDDSGREPRFAMLETIREFALDRLRQEAEHELAIAKAHASYFLAVAEDARVGLVGAHQDRWLARLDAEEANIRDALAWTMETDSAESALQFARALWRYWSSRGRLAEGRSWLERALSLSGAEAAEPMFRADAHNALGNLLGDIGEYIPARGHYEEALALRRGLGDSDGIAGALNNLGIVASWLGDYDGARALLDESLRIRQTLGDPFGTALSVSNLGDVLLAQGDFVRARELQEESLRLREQAQDAAGSAYSVYNLGEIARLRGNYGEAGRRLAESRRRFQILGDTIGTAYAEWSLADLASRAGDVSRAAALLTRVLRKRTEIGDQRGIIECLEAIGIAAIREDAGLAGVKLLGAAQTQRLSIASPIPPSTRDDHHHDLEAARKRQGPAVVETLLREGRLISPAQALTLAQETLDQLRDVANGPASPS